VIIARSRRSPCYTRHKSAARGASRRDLLP
jgi:hypothetical protein